MSSVDLLLYRPWSDTTKKGQEEPVDFSSRTKKADESDVDLGYTDIDSPNQAAQNHQKPAPGNESQVLRNSQQVTYSLSGANDRDFGVSSPDSGFSSPSDGTALSYHHLLPGLYQQALANHALQREAFYRDAIQRELSRQQLCSRPEFQDQKLCPISRENEDEQIAPLALVVKKDGCNSDSSDSEEAQNSIRTSISESSSENDTETAQKFGTAEEKLVHESRTTNDSFQSDQKNKDGREVDWEANKPTLLAGAPQTSPYHLFPPALYWPHGSTPLANQLTKPINHPFSSVAPIDHPLHKALPPPVNGHTLSGNMFSTTNNPLASPLGQHLSNSIASSLAGQQHQQLDSQLTSPLTSPAARAAYDLRVAISSSSNPFANFKNQTSTCSLSPRLGTPKSDAKTQGASGMSLKRKLGPAGFSPDKKSKSPKKAKASRRLNFDEDKSSPVSGTIIRELVEGEEPLVVRKGDIDPAYNVVEVTEEAKAEIAKIENKIGDYVCRLCKELYDDAFGLAQHRCSRIIHVEYRCPECDKVFNCPANLASHRRWHKPKGGVPGSSKAADETSKSSTSTTSATGSHFTGSKATENDCQPSTSKAAYEDEFPSEDDNSEGKEIDIYDCSVCFKSFKRQAYLRKHMLTHRREQDDSSGTVLQPIPQKLTFQPQISNVASQSHGVPIVPSAQTHIPTGHMISPLSPPMLSPPFSPPEVFKCHICQSNFFSATSLAIHFATTHQRDPRCNASFPAGNGFVEMALNNLATSSSTFGSAIPLPRPHYSPGQAPHFPAQLLHRPSQISATS